jgi:aminoglycoside 6'-N-acetyltransferase I
MAEWVALRHALWPNGTVETLAREARELLDRDRAAAFIVRDGAEAIAFAEVYLRDFANGCESSPVAFVEGLYVVPKRRGRGIARKLCEAIEGWAKERGCTELGSDVLLNNRDSQNAHLALGFQETERVVYYRKPLD